MVVLAACLLCACTGAKPAAVRHQPARSTSTTAPLPSDSPPPLLTPSGAVVAVSPKEVEDGENVTISGNQCPPPDGIYAGYAETGDSFDQFTRDPDGRWSITVPVPAGVNGQDPLTAMCEDDEGTPIFKYPTVVLTVHSPYTLTVLPSDVVSPGETLTVKPTSVSFCTSIDTLLVGVAPVENVTLPYDTQTEWPYPFNVFSLQHPSADTVLDNELWSATFTLPASTPPGTYWVQATCAYSRSQPTPFVPHELTVVAPTS